MTGFARAEDREPMLAWAWEARSVNGKGLDVRLRRPAGREALEAQARADAAAAFRRGNVTLTLTVAREAAGARLAVNRAALAELVAEALAVARQNGLPPPSIGALLAVRGVVEPIEPVEDEETRTARETAIRVTLGRTLKALAATRREEGARLAAVLTAQLDRIAALREAAAQNAATQPEAIRTRLRAQVAELLAASPALSEERLAQEAALLATKADIREELDRLAAHIASAREMLRSGEAVGRRLDFLCQELNREANTLCSKSADIALTRIGLDLKATIEQFREQVQNVE